MSLPLTVLSPICDSYVRPAELVRICDECNFGSYGGRCVVCGAPGVSVRRACITNQNRTRTIVPNAPDSKKTETAAPRQSTWVIREWTPYLTGKCKTCFKKANLYIV